MARIISILNIETSIERLVKLVDSSGKNTTIMQREQELESSNRRGRLNLAN
jgi:hypothetical protein